MVIFGHQTICLTPNTAHYHEHPTVMQGGGSIVLRGVFVAASPGSLAGVEGKMNATKY